MSDRIIGAEIVEKFLHTLLEPQVRTDDWPEYEDLLAALDAGLALEASSISDADGDTLYRIVETRA